MQSVFVFDHISVQRVQLRCVGALVFGSSLEGFLAQTLTLWRQLVFMGIKALQ